MAMVFDPVAIERILRHLGCHAGACAAASEGGGVDVLKGMTGRVCG